MPNERASIEVIAPNVDDAIARGLAELGLGVDDVDVEVLDAGSGGILGLGARDARVRLTVRPARPVPEVEFAPAMPAIAEVEAEDPIFHVARETLTELLAKMHIAGELSLQWGEPPSPEAPRPLHAEIRGDDAAELIGHRGEGLNALQYIARLIVGRELNQAVHLVLDVDRYRTRREEQLIRLAQRMAEQALQRNRIMALEPMPANERRIVHLALHDHPDVYTESVGEGPGRKVTIIPKKLGTLRGTREK